MKINYRKTHNLILSVLLLVILFGAVHVFAESGNGFVSMTKFPAFAKATSSAGLGTFINTLYTYLIGIASVLAILEIIWGGFLWMGSGASVTSKEQGKNKITMALSGLILVISPVIIFSIINPQVLSLNLGSNKIAPSKHQNNNICSSVHGTYYPKKADCKWGNVLGDGSNQVCVLVVSGGACGVIAPNGSLVYFAQYGSIDKKTGCQIETTKTFTDKAKCQDYYSHLDFKKTGAQKKIPVNDCNLKLVPDICPKT